MNKIGKSYDLFFFYLYVTDGLFWIRFFDDNGCGFHGKNILKHPLLFAERNNYYKRIQIGNWSFRFLKKTK